MAQERDFYRIKELNSDEEKFLLLILHDQTKENVDIVRKQMEIYKKPLLWQKGIHSLIVSVKSAIYNDNPLPINVEELFSEAERFAESAVNDMIEDLYCGQESELVKMLDQLKMGNLSFCA